MPIFASTRAIPYFIIQCACFPKSQDYYHRMLAANERFAIDWSLGEFLNTKLNF